MRLTGTRAYGVRLPVISPGDDLVDITVKNILGAVESEQISIEATDVIGITEAVVAKAQGNYAGLDDIALDISDKFPLGTVGLVFPILSRNRFLNILKGICNGAKKVYVLLSCPSDEVGNPLIDVNRLDEFEEKLSGMMPGEEFKSLTGNFLHPFTGMDYIDIYGKCGDNVEVFVSKDPRDILKLTKNVLVCEIHGRFRTKERLLRAGAENVYCLSDILSSPVNNSGFNGQYGVLGSNMSTDEKLKLFPRDCDDFVRRVRTKIFEKTGVSPEVMVYGDGAFKDPTCGIWELADPVVSPAYTERLGGQPNEIKLKFVADNVFNHLTGESKTNAVTEMIKTKGDALGHLSEGTTPRKYADLLGSLCDLMSGSGDKGTPVVLIKGYFDNYAAD